MRKTELKYMQKTATVRATVERKLKADAEAVLEKIGLTTSQAITIYLKQITLYKGIPFEVKIPNKATLKSLEDTKRKKNLEKFKTTDELFDSLEI
jgi:DNA-damage-inducible protein J